MVAVLLSCGTDPAVDLRHQGFARDAEAFAQRAPTPRTRLDEPAEPNSLGNVVFNQVPGKTTIAEPSRVPGATESIRQLKVVFWVEIDATRQSDFVFNKDRFALAYGSATPPTAFDKGSDPNVTVTQRNFTASMGGSRQTGEITFVVDFEKNNGGGVLSSKIRAAVENDTLLIRPFYSLKGNGYGGAESGSIVGTGANITLKTDKGVINNPVVVGDASVSDGVVSVSFQPPSDLTASQPQGGALVDAGTSSIGGFVVAYWQEEECINGGPDAWLWDINPKISTTETTTCTYAPKGSSSQNPCDLGCSRNPVAALAGLAPEDVAIPKGIPAAGAAPSKKGCVNVMRVAASERQVALADLENGKPYFAVVWPLDSSGSLGRAKSACRPLTAIDVELASIRRDPSLKNKKEQSKCFVVTAASGSPDSRAVRAWRTLRNRYLKESAFEAWYWENGPKMAAWVNAHPAVKPPLNALLEASGRTLVWVDDQARGLMRLLTRFVFGEQAFAQGLDLPHEDTAVDPAERKVETTPATGIPPPAASASPAPSASPAAAASASPAPAAEPTSDANARPIASPPPVASPNPIASPEPLPANAAPTSEPRAQEGNAAQSGHRLDARGENQRGNGSSSEQFRVSAAWVLPSADRQLFSDVYEYPKKKPLRFQAAQIYRLFDAAGEFGLGGGISYMQAAGSVQASGTSIKVGMYSYGVQIVADYRLRITAHPWFAPRLSFGGGFERFREEAIVDSVTTSSGSGSTTFQSPKGISLWKPTAFGRGALEIGMASLFGGEAREARFGYGLEEFVLSAHAEYLLDFGKGLRLTGLQVGAGIGFLFL